MSNSKDYTITTLSNNLSQRNQPVFSQGVNSPVSLRDKCSPYTVVATPEGDQDSVIAKFPFGRIEPDIPPPSLDQTINLQLYASTAIVYQPTLYDSGVVWFKMDEGTGTSITSSNGLYSGSFEAGAIPLSWESGSYSTGSYSLYFNGSSCVVTPPTSAWPTDEDTQISVSTWFRQRGDRSGGSANQCLFTAHAGGSRIFGAWLTWAGFLYWNSGNASGFTSLTYDWVNSQYGGSSQWHHFGFTRNSSTGKLSMFIDGQEVLTGTGHTEEFTTITTSYIGKWPSGYNIAGNMNDFAVWNTELSEAEMNTIYNDGSGSNPSAISPANLTVLYPFQEGVGSTCYDKSGNSRDGTISVPSWALADPTPQPRTFVNVPEDAGSYIKSDYNVNYTTGSSPGPISVSTWVKFNNPPESWDAIMTFDDLDAGSAWTKGWAMWWNSNKFYWLIPGGGSAAFSGVDANFAQQQWNHIVGTWDNSTVKIYVNGVLGGTTAAFSGDMLTEDCTLQLGDAYSNTSAGLDGKLDDVKIWSGKALTQEEVTALYNGRVIS